MKDSSGGASSGGRWGCVQLQLLTYINTSVFCVEFNQRILQLQVSEEIF